MSAQVPPRRPATVRLAAGLLVGMATTGVMYAAANLMALDGTVARFRSATIDVPDQGMVDAVVTLVQAATVLGGVVAVLVGALLVALALGLLADRTGARGATWAVCGLGLSAGVTALVLLVGQRLVPLRLDPDEPTAARLLNTLAQAYPDGWLPLNAGLSIAQTLGYLVVGLLLVRPSVESDPRRQPVSRPALLRPADHPVAPR